MIGEYDVVWINHERMKEIMKQTNALTFGAFMQICSEYWYTGEPVKVDEIRSVQTLCDLTDEEIDQVLSVTVPLLENTENGLLPPSDLWSDSDPYIAPYVELNGDHNE